MTFVRFFALAIKIREIRCQKRYLIARTGELGQALIVQQYARSFALLG